MLAALQEVIEMGIALFLMIFYGSACVGLLVGVLTELARIRGLMQASGRTTQSAAGGSGE